MEIKINGKKSSQQAQIEELLSVLAQKGIITAQDISKIKAKKK